MKIFVSFETPKNVVIDYSLMWICYKMEDVRKICFHLKCMSWESPYKFKIHQNFNRHIFRKINFRYDKIQHIQTLRINAFKITKMLSDRIFDGPLEFLLPRTKKRKKNCYQVNACMWELLISLYFIYTTEGSFKK